MTRLVFILLLILSVSHAFSQTAGRSNSSADQPVMPDTTAIQTKIPTYPGGDQARMEFISANFRYPKDARRKNKQGKVLIRFVVDTEGNVIDPVILHSVYPSVDKEVIRVVKLMHWNPGEQNGQRVKVYFTLPLNLTLE